MNEFPILIPVKMITSISWGAQYSPLHDELMYYFSFINDHSWLVFFLLFHRYVWNTYNKTIVAIFFSFSLSVYITFKNGAALQLAICLPQKQFFMYRAKTKFSFYRKKSTLMLLFGSEMVNISSQPLLFCQLCAQKQRPELIIWILLPVKCSL